jgi:hypothetical protein
MRTLVGVLLSLVIFAITWILVAFALAMLFSISIPRINDPGEDGFLNQLKIWVLSPGAGAYCAIYFSALIVRPINLRYLVAGFLGPVAALSAFGFFFYASVIRASGFTLAGSMSFLLFALQITAIFVGAFLAKEFAE